MPSKYNGTIYTRMSEAQQEALRKAVKTLPMERAAEQLGMHHATLHSLCRIHSIEIYDDFDEMSYPKVLDRKVYDFDLYAWRMGYELTAKIG